jgi:hypothetical protein
MDRDGNPPLYYRVRRSTYEYLIMNTPFMDAVGYRHKEVVQVHLAGTGIDRHVL